jgi:hypothetical protein
MPRRQVIEQLDASLAIPQGDRSDYVIAAASIIASVRPCTCQPICCPVARLIARGPPVMPAVPAAVRAISLCAQPGAGSARQQSRNDASGGCLRLCLQYPHHMALNPEPSFSGDAGQAYGAVRPLLAAVQLRAQLGPPGRPAPRSAAGEQPHFDKDCHVPIRVCSFQSALGLLGRSSPSSAAGEDLCTRFCTTFDI